MARGYCGGLHKGWFVYATTELGKTRIVLLLLLLLLLLLEECRFDVAVRDCDRHCKRLARVTEIGNPKSSEVWDQGSGNQIVAKSTSPPEEPATDCNHTPTPFLETLVPASHLKPNRCTPGGNAIANGVNDAKARANHHVIDGTSSQCDTRGWLRSRAVLPRAGSTTSASPKRIAKGSS